MARILLVGNFYATYLNEELFNDRIVIADGTIKELVDAAAKYLRDDEATNGRCHDVTYVFMVMGITDLVKKQLVSGRYLLEPQPHPVAVIDYEMRRAVDVCKSYGASLVWTTTYPISLAKYHKSQGWSSWDLSRFNVSSDFAREQEVLFNNFDKVMKLCRSFNDNINAPDIFLLGNVYYSVENGRDFREELLMDDGINPVEEVIGLWNQQLRPYLHDLRCKMPSNSSSSAPGQKEVFNARSGSVNYRKSQESPMKRSKVENALMENLGKQSSKVQKELAMGMLKFISEKLGDDLFFSAKGLVPDKGPMTNKYQPHYDNQYGSQSTALLPEPVSDQSVNAAGLSNYRDTTELSNNPATSFNSSLPIIPNINNLVDMSATNNDSQSYPKGSLKSFADNLTLDDSQQPLAQQHSRLWSDVPHVPLLPQTPGNQFARAYNRYAMMPDPMKLFVRDSTGEWRKQKIAAIKYLYKNATEKKSLMRFQHKFFAEKLRHQTNIHDSVAIPQALPKTNPLLPDPDPVVSVTTHQSNGSQLVVKPLLELGKTHDIPSQLYSEHKNAANDYHSMSQVKAMFKEKTGMRKVSYYDRDAPVISVTAPTSYAVQTPFPKAHSQRDQKILRSKAKVYRAVDVLTSLSYPVIEPKESQYARSGLIQAVKENYILMAKPGNVGNRSHLRVKATGRSPGLKSNDRELLFYPGNHPPAVEFLEVEAVVPGREDRDCVMTPLQCDVATFNLQLYHLMNKRARLIGRLRKSTDPSIHLKISHTAKAESSEVHDETADSQDDDICSNAVSPSANDMIVLSEISNNQNDDIDAEDPNNTTEATSNSVVDDSEAECESDNQQSAKQEAEVAEAEIDQPTYAHIEEHVDESVPIIEDAHVDDSTGQACEASNA